WTLPPRDRGPGARRTLPVRPLEKRDEHVRRPQQGAFGDDAFGRTAERIARMFGTPAYLLGQTIGVAIWITVNSIGLAYHWDPRPYILLNLLFSIQAAYAAP